MKTKAILANIVVSLLLGILTVSAGERMSDAAIKQKLLGYWKSPRHEYLIKSDGIMYMLPREEGTTTNRWDVKGGKFYQDGGPYEIVSLTAKKFVYRGSSGPTFTLTRMENYSE